METESEDESEIESDIEQLIRNDSPHEFVHYIENQPESFNPSALLDTGQTLLMLAGKHGSTQQIFLIEPVFIMRWRRLSKHPTIGMMTRY